MNTISSFPQEKLIPLDSQEMRDVTAGGFLLESAVWLFGAIYGAASRVSDEDSGFCDDDQTFSRRHGVCI